MWELGFPTHRPAERDSIAVEGDGLFADCYLAAVGLWRWLGAGGEELEAEFRSASRDFVVAGRTWAHHNEHRIRAECFREVDGKAGSVGPA